MKIYWTNKSIPEFAGFSPKERKRIWRASYSIAVKKEKAIWFGPLIGGLLAGLGSYFGNIYQHSIIGAAIGGGIGGFFYGQIVIRVLRPYIQRYVSQENGG